MKQNIDYVDHKSIMVINTKGVIRQLFVPIRVQVITPTNILQVNSWVIVEEIQAHKEHKLLYKIGNNWWQYHLFRIAVVF